MKFVILAPLNVRTGGPEACFQLSDMMIRSGFDTQMWLIKHPAYIPVFRALLKQGAVLAQMTLKVEESQNTVGEYSHYQVKAFDGQLFQEETVIIIPETYLWMLPLLSGLRVLVWWLSVDNAFEALSRINCNLLRAPLVRHAVQSAYASDFVRALGLKASPLSDYTVVDKREAPGLAARPVRAAINTGAKVNAQDLEQVMQRLRQQCPEVDIVPIASLGRQQVYAAFSTSRLYIDLGNFPGKDRMAREALLLGANILIHRAGAGAHADDFAVPETYRPLAHEAGHIAQLATHMLLNPMVHAAQFERARSWVRQEKIIFEGEVLQTFSAYLSPRLTS